jgi:hypothetical protein
MAASINELPKGKYTPGLESRKKRRDLVDRIIAQLEDVLSNEETCMDNMPENLWESETYANAEQAAGSIRDAIETLGYAY